MLCCQYLLNPNCKRCWLALSLSISISLSRNLTLNDLGRCCGIRVTPGSVQHLTILLVRFIARLYIGNWFPLVRVFARNLLLLPINDSTSFKIPPRRWSYDVNRKLPAISCDCFMYGQGILIATFVTGCILLSFRINQNCYGKERNKILNSKT